MSAPCHPASPQASRLDLPVAELKSRLVRREQELMAQDADLRDRLAAEQAVTTNTFVAGTEGARATEDDDEVIALLRHEQVELMAVQAALERLAEGTYGDCLACGEPIGIQRLSVLPEAALCVDCQDVAEHRVQR